MSLAEEGNGADSPDRLNYFNYFTEVEEEFVRRRGKAMLISPIDWALVESWKNAGIPLHVVLRAINRAFDAYEARARKYRRVNSVFYCQQEVEATYAEYLHSQVGAPPPPGDPPAPAGEPAGAEPAKARPVAAFPKEVLLDFLSRCAGELTEAEALATDARMANVSNALERARRRLAGILKEIERAEATDAEALEHDLDGIDRLILAGLRQAVGEDGLKGLHAEAEAQLRSYQNKMEKAIYDRTVENFVARRLRENHHVPRLSLFYL